MFEWGLGFAVLIGIGRTPESASMSLPEFDYRANGLMVVSHANTDRAA